MDGVLVDNIDIHIEAFGVFCERYGGAENWREIIMNSVGMGNDEIMAQMFPAEFIEREGIAKLASEKEAIYREIYASRIQPVEGLTDLLKEFKSRGIKCAVGSSGCRENVEFVIESCGIKEYFDVLIYSDLVTRCKPDPEIYDMAISKLGIKPDQALIFEDALAGIESAKAANAGKIIALATTSPAESFKDISGIDRVITNFREVVGVL